MNKIPGLISKLFHRKKTVPQVAVNGQGKKGNFRKFLSKISGSFMLPISVMAIAGLFLGVGATIATQAKGGVADATNAGVKLGQFIQNARRSDFCGDADFICSCDRVAFTDEAGVGVFRGDRWFFDFLSVFNQFLLTRF
ncbi:hypothetical protein [Mycoplasma sp. ATU-Cv-508]|uniref:hypothetical protein n=1 Tax=Mycoplasma sp. ATU-Cv-508 TaxID=2048001 RepID=UPI001F448CFB